MDHGLGDLRAEEASRYRQSARQKAKLGGERQAGHETEGGAVTMAEDLKPVPEFGSEAEERAFWESQDSADYIDWSKALAVRLPYLKPSQQEALCMDDKNITY